MVKDNIYTDDKHNTSEGGLVLLGGRYSSEATVVAKIRAAGGVLLGHAALSEAADHRALSNFSDGYSTRVGQTRNPFNLTQPTSGSSGGSVVAVRSNQVAVALGSETHGYVVFRSSPGINASLTSKQLSCAPSCPIGSLYSQIDPGFDLETWHCPGQLLSRYPGTRCSLNEGCRYFIRHYGGRRSL